MIKNKFKDSIYYSFEELDQVKNLFTSKIGWEDENTLIREIFKKDLEIISLKQVHGKEVFKVDGEFLEEYRKKSFIEGDGLITDREDVILKTYHADCTPLYFCDRKKKVIGVSHAGWKGTYSNILKETIEKMIESYGSSIDDIEVAIGPSIKLCCYEVSKDLYSDFKNIYPYDEAYSVKEGKFFIDCQIINYSQARDLGVKEENIYLSNLCTACNLELFYSYRKEKTSGRLSTAISL